jgi:hypothetical protein
MDTLANLAICSIDKPIDKALSTVPFYRSVRDLMSACNAFLKNSVLVSFPKVALKP